MMELSGGLFLVWVLGFLAGCGEAALPIVMWHGFGGHRNSSYVRQVEALVKQEFPGIYVRSIGIGVDATDDVKKTKRLHMNTQVSQACDMISNDPELVDGYNAIGFSFGGLLLRGVIQRCPDPPVNNFITLGSPHQGIYGWSGCIDGRLCNFLRRTLLRLAYWRPIQNRYTAAQMWHDPMREATYRRRSTFLADINNENRNYSHYKENLMKLSNFVMVRFTQERVIIPPESTWFGFYRSGSRTLKESLTESSLYRQDRLGLKQMDEEGKIIYLEASGPHVVFTDTWFTNTIMPYLR